MALSADEVLTTTRAVRRRLDFELPVARELLIECVETAVQAPSGSDRQDWHFLLISDANIKLAIAELYRRSWAELYPPRRHHQTPPRDHASARRRRMADSSHFLAENLEFAPWLVIPVREGRPPSDWRQAGWWAGVLPAFWSFMLAARARGMGTAWTAAHLAYEREAAALLDIPFDDVTQAGLSPVAHVAGSLRPAVRKPASAVIHWQRWSA
jgi:nitroreductase